MKEQIKEIISHYMQNKTGILSVGWIDFNHYESFYYCPNLIMPTASVYKVFILSDLARGIYEGKRSWQDRIVLRKQDQSVGSGILSYMTAGISMTLMDYARLMMMISDNTAADILFHLCGRESIQEHILQPCGLLQTQCNISCRDMIERYYECVPREDELSQSYFRRCTKCLNKTPYFLGLGKGNNVTTAKDMTSFLKQLYKGNVVNSTVSSKILSIMKLCQTNTRIPRYLPHNVSVAHKTGTMDRIANDVGIVYTACGDYALSLFYNGNSASKQEYACNEKGMLSDQLLANLSRDIYKAFISHYNA
jgi:beta-lactamase class A